MIDYIPKHKKILVFSPHPDDDIIGVGVTMYKIAQRGNLFKIAYLTDGERGITEKISDHKKKQLRRKEAIRANKILGVHEKNLEFMDLPFYKTRVPDLEDIEAVYNMLTTFMPDIVFVCIDEDPNSTHKKSAEIIDEALLQYEIKTIIYCYNSIWADFKPNEVNFCVGFNEELMQLKIHALMEHKSQLKNPDFNPPEQSFLTRVIEKDKNLAQRLDLKTSYAEGFFQVESL